MARAYTAWVLQKGPNEDAEYIGLAGGYLKVTKRITEAFQASRETDARNLRKYMVVEMKTGFRVKERNIN